MHLGWVFYICRPKKINLTLFKCMYKLLIFLILSLVSCLIPACGKTVSTYFEDQPDHWVDSVFHSLSLEAKIGQLLLLPIQADPDNDYNSLIINILKKYKPGGFISGEGSLTSHIEKVNKLQKTTRTPLLFALNLQNDISLPFDSCLKYPSLSTLGSITNDTLIERLGPDLGKQFNRLGINLAIISPFGIKNHPEKSVPFSGQTERILKILSPGLGSQKILLISNQSSGFDDLKIAGAFSTESREVADEGFLNALKSGNDLYIHNGDPEKAIELIKDAIEEGMLSREVIDLKCRKILIQ